MDTVTATLIKVCVRCGHRPDREPDAPCMDAEGRERPAGHVLQDREPCRSCGGGGAVPFEGAWLSRDPRNWDSCGTCEGVGVEGVA